MAIDISTLNGYMESAITALAAGDYATALNNALAAQGVLALIPDMTRASGTGGGTQTATFDRISIDSFIKRVRQQQGGGLGIQSQSVEFVRPVSYANEFGTTTYGGTQ